MNLNKLNKSELIHLVEDLKKELEISESKLTKYDIDFKRVEETLNKLELEKNILINSKKEDSEKIIKAETVLKNFEQREHDLIQNTQNQLRGVKKTLDEQNETIINLFDMLDNTINLNINYYNKYKSIFLKTTNIEIEEE